MGEPDPINEIDIEAARRVLGITPYIVTPHTHGDDLYTAPIDAVRNRDTNWSMADANPIADIQAVMDRALNTAMQPAYLVMHPRTFHALQFHLTRTTIDFDVVVIGWVSVIEKWAKAKRAKARRMASRLKWWWADRPWGAV